MWRSKKTTTIARCERRIEAARHLYEDDEIGPEEYLRRDVNFQEITYWKSCATVSHALRGSRRGESNHVDQNRLARNVFESIVYDVEKQEIVDFKPNPLYEQSLVLRAEGTVREDEQRCLKHGPGRDRTYDIPLKRRLFYH